MSHSKERNYIIQHDDYSCGPIALINSYYHLYNKYPCDCPITEYPRKAIDQIGKECETTKTHGTELWNLSHNSIIQLKKTTYNINKILNYDAFILLYSFKQHPETQHKRLDKKDDQDVVAHYIFVHKTDDNYKIHNDRILHNEEYMANPVLNKEQFTTKYLKHNPRIEGLDFPVAWVI